MVVLNLTLQLVRPLFPDRAVRAIYGWLNGNACLILSEKQLGNVALSLFDRPVIKFCFDMKRRNDYRDRKIARPREAFEGVLIPCRMDGEPRTPAAQRLRQRVLQIVRHHRSGAISAH